MLSAGCLSHLCGWYRTRDEISVHWRIDILTPIFQHVLGHQLFPVPGFPDLVFIEAFVDSLSSHESAIFKAAFAEIKAREAPFSPMVQSALVLRMSTASFLLYIRHSTYCITSAASMELLDYIQSMGPDLTTNQKWVGCLPCCQWRLVSLPLSVWKVYVTWGLVIYSKRNMRPDCASCCL